MIYLVSVLPRSDKGSSIEYKALLSAVRSQGVATRSELAAVCGFPRSSVSLRIRELLDAGLLAELDGTEPTGGRRAGRVSFRSDAGVVLAIELGSTHARWRLADFAAATLAEDGFPIVIASGAQDVFEPVETQVRQALERQGLPVEAIRSCAVGFPGPINFSDGRVAGPPHMAGWEDAPVATLLQKFVHGPIVVDNDVNVMAWGEYDSYWHREGVHDLLFIKHGTGIGCGIIAAGQIYRGYDGTAGEVGHIGVCGVEPAELCSCGSKNCLEVVASGRALVKKLQAQGYAVETASDISRLVLQGDLVAMSLVRDAGKALGAVMSGIVSFFNPAVIVMGGSLGALEISLLAGMREATYAQGTMFSTRHLRIVPSTLGPEAGLRGATLLALDVAYDSAIELVDGQGR
jgi:predicted NBD/HSP70 family sugar kinase